MTPQRSARLALALGLLIALSANLTYALPKGGVVVGLGLIAPLVLPVVLWLRTLFTADNVWHKLLREVATAAVAGPAVAISYSHTFSLVLDAHEPWLIAILAPLSSDGLAGLATLALHRIRATPVQKEGISDSSGVEVPQSRPSQVARPAPAAVDPAPVAHPKLAADDLTAARRAKEAEKKRRQRAAKKAATANA